MKSNGLRKKTGIVILLDALGASEYSEEKIRKFLAARTEINGIVADFAKRFPREVLFSDPAIYTFGDTIIVTVQLRGRKDHDKQIVRAIMIMRRYLFHSIEQGILFRGAFSVGQYIEDGKTNTVMGEALTDAAQWYEQAEWMGIASTPRTNSALEYYLNADYLALSSYITPYPVPIKDGSTLDLYAISWPGAFHEKTLLKKSKKESPRKWFLEILKDLPFPRQATQKYKNTKDYFSYVESLITADS
jgi:hypothetical protein